MKLAYAIKYVLGTLAALALTGLLVWLIGREGERTRQAIRDARRDAETAPSVVPQPAQGKAVGPLDRTESAPGARDTPLPANGPEPQKPGLATAADRKPAVAESAAGTEEDFNLDDHVVFPGLADEVSKTRAKPRVDPPPGNRESDAEKTNHTGSK
ncbi:MAG: hypothetical protein NTY19_43160 [Planctomycetota bacterium]|nr:hypothetical protein [Planctomycetota bacterium]